MKQKSQHAKVDTTHSEGNHGDKIRRQRRTSAKSYNEEKVVVTGADSPGDLSEDSTEEATITDVTINRQNTLGSSND